MHRALLALLFVGCGAEASPGGPAGEPDAAGRLATEGAPAESAPAESGAAQASRSFPWTPTLDEPGCCDPHRLVVAFDGADELAAAGLTRAAAAKTPPHFAGGIWTAPAGKHDMWHEGPHPWSRLAVRAHGWAVTAEVAIDRKKAPCTANSGGPGIRIDGYLGHIAVTLLPDALLIGSKPYPIAPGRSHTVKIAGHGDAIDVSVDGTELAMTSPLPSTATPPTIAFGQKGCSDFESRWDRLIVEAGIDPCRTCRPGEHFMIAAIRERLPSASVDTSGTEGAHPRCLAYAAVDHTLRALLPSTLAGAGQAQRASQLENLRPLVDRVSTDFAVRVVRPMGVAPQRPGCDPVRSPRECDFELPEVTPLPPLVANARTAIPNLSWADHTAAGREAMLRYALAIHTEAGPDATAELLERLVALARPGGSCNP